MSTCKQRARAGYGTIQIIRKLKNFAGYRLRKHLVESLVLSKLDYCDTVYYPLPEFQLKRLQRVQLVAASFVLSRYVNDINDIVKMGWLPVREWKDFHVLKLVHQALHSPSWPSYVRLNTVKHLRFCGQEQQLDWLYQWRGAPFKTLLPSYLMSFLQILETVAISKYTVRKLRLPMSCRVGRRNGAVIVA